MEACVARRPARPLQKRLINRIEFITFFCSGLTNEDESPIRDESYVCQIFLGRNMTLSPPSSGIDLSRLFVFLISGLILHELIK